MSAHTVWLRQYEDRALAQDKRGRLRELRPRATPGAMKMEWCQQNSAIPFGEKELKTDMGIFRLVGMAKHANGDCESLYELRT